MKASKARRAPEYISTGMAPLDEIMGGGVMLGRISHFSGAPSTGKTTVAYMVAANAQKMGKKVKWYDTEKRFEFDFAESLGVDLNKLDYEREAIAEKIFEDMIEWCGENDGLAILDSVGGLHTKNEAEGGVVSKYPDAPKLIPIFMRYLVISLEMKQSAALLLNHEKKTFGGALKIMGGDAIPYHSTTWVRFRRNGEKVTKGKTETASGIEAKIWKGKFRNHICSLMQKDTGGFDMDLLLVYNAIGKGIITRTGNTYFLGEEKLCVGLEKMKAMFDDTAFAERIKELIG